MSSIQSSWASSITSVATAGVLYVWFWLELSSAIFRSSDAGRHRSDAPIARCGRRGRRARGQPQTRRRRRSTSAARSSRRRPRRGPSAARRRPMWRRRRRAVGGGAPGRRSSIATPVEVSLWVSAYRSMPSSATGSGWLPGSVGRRSGRRGGARRRRRRRTSTRTRRTRGAGSARGRARTSRRPRTRSSRRCRARSPNRRGDRTASVSFDRTAPTRFFTGGLRCDVPSSVSRAATIASTCSWRTLDGPQQNRPSLGRRSVGMVMSAGSVLTRPSMAVSNIDPTATQPVLPEDALAHPARNRGESAWGAAGLWQSWLREPDLANASPPSPHPPPSRSTPRPRP